MPSTMARRDCFTIFMISMGTVQYLGHELYFSAVLYSAGVTQKTTHQATAVTDA